MDAKPSPETASARRPFHPDVDALVAYHHHRLDADAVNSVRQHLARCKHCARLLLDLESFSSAESDSVPPRQVAEARLLARAVVQQARAEHWRKAALATSILLALVLPVALYYGTQVKRSLRGRELSPEINLAIISLNPLSSLRSAEGARLSLAPDARSFALVLNTVNVRAFSEYSLVVWNQTGREILSRDGLHPSTLGTFNLSLPTSRFEPGEYRLKLFGLSDKRREPVEEYSLEIVAR